MAKQYIPGPAHSSCILSATSVWQKLFGLNTPSQMPLETQHFLKLQIHLDHLRQQAGMRSDNLSTTIPKKLSRH